MFRRPVELQSGQDLRGVTAQFREALHEAGVPLESPIRRESWARRRRCHHGLTSIEDAVRSVR
jgi:hypothetical protein